MYYKQDPTVFHFLFLFLTMKKQQFYETVKKPLRYFEGITFNDAPYLLFREYPPPTATTNAANPHLNFFHNAPTKKTSFAKLLWYPSSFTVAPQIPQPWGPTSLGQSRVGSLLSSIIYNQKVSLYCNHVHIHIHGPCLTHGKLTSQNTQYSVPSQSHHILRPVTMLFH